MALYASSSGLFTARIGVSSPSNLSGDKRTRLMIFATGIRMAANTDITNDLVVDGFPRANVAESVQVEARLQNGSVYMLPVEYAGVEGRLAGLDQINIVLDARMQGAGNVELTLILNGRRSNIATATRQASVIVQPVPCCASSQPASAPEPAAARQATASP